MATESKIDAKIDGFRARKWRKIDEKSPLKFILFSTSFWERFCIDFGRVLGGLGRPWGENRGKIGVQKATSMTTLVSGSFREALGRILGAFWEGLGVVLGGSGSLMAALGDCQGCFARPGGHAIPSFLWLYLVFLAFC